MSISEAQLKEAMDSYGNIRHLIEMLEANRLTTYNTILQKYPDAKRELEELEDEMGEQLKQAKETEKQQRKTLNQMIDQFSKTALIKDTLRIRSNLILITLEKEVSYDSAALDGYLINDPRIAAFRSEKINTRLTLNKI